MGLAATRRGLGALVAIAIGLLPALVQPITAGGVTSTGTLSGVTGQSWTTLSRIDRGTGAITPIAQFAGPNNDQITGLTGDPATHRIFAIHTTVTPAPKVIVNTSYVVTINSLTGAFTSSPATSGFLGSIKYDTSSNILYGLTTAPTGQSLVRLDPSTGAATTVASFASTGPVSMSMEVAPGANTVYINSETLSFALPPPPPTSQVLTVNTLTGGVTTSPVLNRTTRSITYDTSANKLYGATECCPRDLVQINPTSGAEQFIGNIHATPQQNFGNMVTDSASHTVLADVQFQGTGFTWDDHIVAINTVTGLATTGPAIFAGSIGALYFEPTATPPVTSTGTLYGLVFGPTVNIGTIDPLTGVLTPGVNVGLPPGQLAPGFGPWANDAATHRFFLVRVLYTLGSPPPPTTSQLLTVNSGTVSASPTLTRTLGALAFDSSSGTLYGITDDKWIVRVDPATGAMTNLAAVTGDMFDVVVAPASHALYILSRTNGTIATRLLTMDTVANVVTTGPLFTPPVRGILYDTSLGALFGLTFCCPSGLVRIDTSSGAGTAIGNATLGLGGGYAIDSASHTVFATQDVLGAFGQSQYIASINDQTGAKSLSPAISIATAYVSRLIFEPLTAAPPDTSPPATSIGIVPAPNAAGWNNTNVTLNLSATDPDGVADVATVHYSTTGAQTIAPTVVACSSASFVLNTEGVTTVTYFAKDKAGNTEAAHAQVIRIDKTLPTVTYTGNAGTYTVDQTITITCTAVDPPNANGTAASGLASTTCANVNAPAYSFPLGPHTLSATATDFAGNIGRGTTAFSVQVTTDTLCALTVQIIETSPKFLSLSSQAQKRWDGFANRTCEIFDKGPGEHGPDDKAEKVAAYNKALIKLVGNGFLTTDQAAILLKLAQAVSL